MDAIDLLSNDHRKLEQLFRDYRCAASARHRSSIAQIVIRDLCRHIAVEEALVYPLCDAALGGCEVDGSRAVHQEIKTTLLSIARLGDGDELMEHLRRSVCEHIALDEHAVLPKLRAAVDGRTLDELGGVLVDGKRTAPTRPHPDAPEHPPLTLAGPASTIYNRLRKRLPQRSRT